MDTMPIDVKRYSEFMCLKRYMDKIEDIIDDSGVYFGVANELRELLKEYRKDIQRIYDNR